MSVHVESWAWKQKVGSPIRKLVLVKLAQNADDDGWSWWRQGRMAEECEVTRQTINEHIAALRKMGLVEVTPEQRENGGRGINKYRVMADVGETDRGGRPDRQAPVGEADNREPSVGNSQGELVPSARARVREAWTLAPGMVRHTPAYFASPKVVTAIDKAVKLHGEEEVVAAVGLYAEIVRSPDYRWSHRWPLFEFLERGVDRFVPAADPKTEWRARRSNGKPGLAEAERAELERYDKGTVVLTGEGEDGDDLDVKAVLEKSRAEADRRADEALDRELHPER
jgi:DNA-binding transcriptional ArsR family regulator